MTGKNEQDPLRNRPFQIMHSFEGLANGLDGIEVMPSYGRPRPYILANFEERVRAELQRLAARGIGGLVVNVGFDGYLENEEGWRRFVRGVEMAVELGLRIWIYDENGYPSGSAGGLAIEGHPELEALGIKRMRMGRTIGPRRIPLPHPRARVFAAFGTDKGGQRIALAVEKGSPEVNLQSGEFADLDIYFTAPCFEGTHADYHQTSRKPYINLLDRRAVNRFLSVTHLEYFRRLPPHLWQHVQAVFTDEPSLMSHVLVSDPAKPLYPSIPWSEELSGGFYDRRGYFIEDHVESLFGGRSPEDKKHRRDFWGVVAEMYEEAFAAQSSEVCAAIHVAFSGHLLWEETLWQHAVMHANALGALKHFHIPGIDVLTCEPGLINRVYPFTIKTAISAALLGGQRELMVEIGEYSEYWRAERQKTLEKGGDYWAGPRNANPLGHIKYSLAYCFLAGVREFGFYFPWRAFSDAEYRELTDFVARLNDLGRGSLYQPACALYYPIETIWEEYVPSEKTIQWKALEEQSDRCRRANEVMSETCKNLLHANVQFILVDQRDLPKLQGLGIRTLLYPMGERPSEEAQALCRRMGVETIALSSTNADALTERQKKTVTHSQITAGEGVIYCCYEGFAFTLNTLQRSSSFETVGSCEAVFPLRSPERQRVGGHTELGALECAFVYTPSA